jgi:xanthine/uracil/vitamin C permease (AzgA family)
MSHHEAFEATDVGESAASKLFDLRILIGGLFTLYGVLLTVYSFFTTEAEIQKAAGININLWLGLGMLVLGLLFLLWVRLAPLQHAAEPNPTGRRSDEDEPPESPRRPAAH